MELPFLLEGLVVRFDDFQHQRRGLLRKFAVAISAVLKSGQKAEITVALQRLRLAIPLKPVPDCPYCNRVFQWFSRLISPDQFQSAIRFRHLSWAHLRQEPSGGRGNG